MRLTLLSLAILSITCSANADTVLLEDFEDSTVTYTVNYADDLSDIANLDWYGRIDPGTAALPAGFNYTNLQGNGFYSAHDIDGALTPIPSDEWIQLDWTGIDISNHENLDLSWFVAEDEAADGNEDWDMTTSVRIYTNLDGAGFTQIFGIETEDNAGDQGNEQPRIDTNFDGIGDGAELTDVLTQYSVAVANGSSLDIRLIIEDLDTSDEDILFDHLHLQGDFVAAAVPEPSSFAFLLAGGLVLGFRRRRGNAV